MSFTPNEMPESVAEWLQAGAEQPSMEVGPLQVFFEGEWISEDDAKLIVSGLKPLPPLPRKRWLRRRARPERLNSTAAPSTSRSS